MRVAVYYMAEPRVLELPPSLLAELQLPPHIGSGSPTIERARLHAKEAAGAALPCMSCEGACGRANSRRRVVE